MVVDPALAQQMLARALGHGGDYAELFFEHRQSLQLALADGEVRQVSIGVDGGVGIRVVDRGTVSFAYAESFDPGPMLAAAQTAARSLRAQRAGHAPPPPCRVSAVTLPEDPAPAPEVATDIWVDHLHRCDAAARHTSPAVVRVEASLASVVREILIVHTHGAAVRDVQPLQRLSVTVVALRGSVRAVGSCTGTGSPEEIGREAARIALVNLDARPAPAGSLPVVLAAGDAGIWLHEAVGHGLEADFLQRRSSSYSGRTGLVAAPLVTLHDDPQIPGARGSIAIDDEGVTPTSHRLIDRGMLCGQLHDRLSAHAAGVPPSGSGRRQSFRDLPLPRMTNTWLAAGEDDPHDIIRSVHRGIYAVKFSGGQVNLAAGDFVFGLTEGYLIEDGKITAPLHSVILSGNGPTALIDVRMVGHDLKFSPTPWTCTKAGQNIPVGVGMPTVKLERLTVGGTLLASG